MPASYPTNLAVTCRGNISTAYTACVRNFMICFKDFYVHEIKMLLIPTFLPVLIHHCTDVWRNPSQKRIDWMYI